MDHQTAVAVVINAMQDAEKSPDEIASEVNTLLEAVNPAEREAVLKEATEAYSRLKAGLPFNFDSPR